MLYDSNGTAKLCTFRGQNVSTLHHLISGPFGYGTDYFFIKMRDNSIYSIYLTL